MISYIRRQRTRPGSRRGVPLALCLTGLVGLGSAAGASPASGDRGRAGLRELLRLSGVAWSHLGAGDRDDAFAAPAWSERLDAFCDFTSLTPQLGGVVSGSGIGLGLTQTLYRDQDTVLGWQTLRTHRGYQELGLFHGQDLDPRGRYRLHSEIRYRDLTDERFYGFGMESRAEDRTSYRLQEHLARSELRVELADSMRFSLRADLRNVFPEGGRSSRHPSTGAFFESKDFAGFERSATYAGIGLGLRWDTRDRPSYARSGSLLRAEAAHFASLSDAPSYQRYSVELQHARPLPLHDHVLALRLGGAMRVHPRGTALPFFLTQGLGGSRSLRGYPLDRFRGDDVVYATIEYRAPLVRDRLDAVAFWDTGGAFARPGDVSLDSLRHSFGAGVRVLAHEGVLLRLELARGDEGTRFLVSFSAPF